MIFEEAVAQYNLSGGADKETIKTLRAERDRLAGELAEAKVAAEVAHEDYLRGTQGEIAYGQAMREERDQALASLTLANAGAVSIGCHSFSARSSARPLPAKPKEE
jgi:multidrug resistance efflux pump